MDGIVKSDLEKFLTKRLPGQDLDIVDDIVLMYLTSVLEQLGEDESFNVDEFIEMMNAYIPGFEHIPSDKVYSWIIHLASSLSECKQTQQDRKPEERKPPLATGLDRVTCGQATNANVPSQTTCVDTRQDFQYRVQERVDTDTMTFTAPEDAEFNEKVSSLCEIFPEACTIEVRRCLLVANGNADEAARLMIMSREEQDKGIENGLDSDVGNSRMLVDSRARPHQPGAKRQDLNDRDQENIKSTLLCRYGFVDVGSDQRTHRPTLAMKEEKKLTRYRDNQVVSTKGEKFSMVKNPESEEEKRTYVNLKPARKYRFH